MADINDPVGPSNDIAPPSRKDAGSDILKIWTQHVDIFDRLLKHPQAIVYQRFYTERMMRISYLENKVSRCSRDVIAMYESVKEGPNLDSEEARQKHEQRFEEVMNALLDSLSAHSLAHEQDCKMAAATTVEPYFMDHFRSELQKDGIQRAPNGEYVSIYGNEGEQVSDNFTSMRGVDLEPFSRFIVHRLMNPFFYRVIDPCIGHWNKTFDSWRISQREILDQRVVQSIAKCLEVIVATLSLAVAIIILNIIETMKYRLLCMTLFGLLFSFEVVFLGQGSIGIFALNAGYFAAMVVFVGTTSSAPCSAQIRHQIPAP